MDSTSVHSITMPRWGMTMTEGRLGKWLVQVGDPISVGQEILEVETEKIVNAIEASVSGRLRRIVFEAGSSAPVGALLGVVTSDEVAESEIDAFVAAHRTVHTAEEVAGDAPPQPKFIETRVGRVGVLPMGQGGALPAVLLHGFGGSMNSWLLTQSALANERPVFAIDFPAHGISGIPSGPLNTATLVEATCVVLDALGVQRAHWVGHSLGGLVAAELGTSRPERVASLSLIAPAGLGEDINAAFLDQFLAAERRPQMKQALALLFADAGQLRRDMVDDILRFVRTDGVVPALRSLAQSAFPSGRQARTVRESLGQLRVPVQVLWGTEDRIIPVQHASGLPEPITVRVLQGSGHMPQLEKASQVNALLGDFMRRTEA